MSDETETKLVAADYVVLEAVDVKQIELADDAIKGELVYMYKKKPCLTYMGIKWIVLIMSRKDNPLEFIGMPDVALMKYDEINEMKWVWQAMVKVRNTNTGLESIGVSEHPFIAVDKGGKYDIFGRTTAISKAERNAFRKQISELEIKMLLDHVGPENIKQLERAVTTPMNTKPGEVAEYYLKELEKLGYDGPKPKTSFDACELIKNLEKIIKEETKK